MPCPWGSRLILRQVNETVCCLQEKIASAEGIDRAMVLGTGFPTDEKGMGDLSIGLMRKGWVGLWID
jgi:3-hydroxyacyl-CoA dehydrogenase